MQGFVHLTASPPGRWKEACKRTRAPDNVLTGAFIDNLRSYVRRVPDAHLQILSAVMAEALESLGIDKQARKIAVFTAAAPADFVQNISTHSVSHTIAAMLHVDGPHENTDCGCSSGYLAIDKSIGQIYTGACSTAVVGGILLMIQPAFAVASHSLGSLSDTGHMRPFSNDADGALLGEACGALVLELKTPTQAAQTSIVGQSVVHNSPRLPLGFADPGAMETAANMALNYAGVKSQAVTVAHLHAMGNPAGDIPEMLGVLEALRRGVTDQSLILASHKANIGLSTPASGVFDVIVASLCFQHRLVPKVVNITELSEHLQAGGNVVIPQESAHDLPLKSIIASVNGTGGTGVNVHLVLQHDGFDDCKDFQDVQLIPLAPNHHQIDHATEELQVQPTAAMEATSESMWTSQYGLVHEAESMLQHSIGPNSGTQYDGEPTPFSEGLSLQLSGGNLADVSKIVQEAIVVMVRKMKGIDVRATDPLMQIGINSLEATHLKYQLQRQLGSTVKLPSTLMFDFPTVEKITQCVTKQIFGEVSAVDICTETEIRRHLAETGIAGFSCVTPFGSKENVGFWTSLSCARTTIQCIPWNRFCKEDDDASVVYTSHGHFMDRIELFDNKFFMLSHSEALSTNPCQRLLLEKSYALLSKVGESKLTLIESKVAVFVGYAPTNEFRCPLTVYSTHGSDMSSVAGRVSFVLGLQGSCITLNTACSSSLAAVDLGHTSIQLGKCQQSLVAGVSVLLGSEVWIAMCTLQALSSNGQCKTFDSSADGYGRSEACVTLVLVNSDSRKSTLTMLEGTAINQDGRSASFMAPNGLAQEMLIREAVHTLPEPCNLLGIETHGTGTALGDPIEMGAICRVIQHSQTTTFTGALKSLIGHTEASSGLVSLSKAALSLNVWCVFPNVWLRESNPKMDIDDVNLLMTSEDVQMSLSNPVPLLGTSSFGFSGTNVHAVLQSRCCLIPIAIRLHPVVQYQHSSFVWWDTSSTAAATEGMPLLGVSTTILEAGSGIQWERSWPSATCSYMAKHHAGHEAPHAVTAAIVAIEFYAPNLR